MQAAEAMRIIAVFLILGARSLGAIAYLHPVRSLVWRNGILRSFHCRATEQTRQADATPLPTELEAKLKEYIRLRGEDEKVDVVVLTELEKPPPDAFEMFRPAGWYKDTSKEDFKERSSSRTPKRPHPFSFVELKKYGFEGLSEQITLNGGPHQVGLKIGLDWQDPREVWDESIQPRITDSYTLGRVEGELKLGGSLDDQLAAAEEIDLTELKRAINDLKEKRQSQQQSTDSITDETYPGVAKEYNKDSYKRRARQLQQLEQRYKEAEEAQRERFSLNSTERLSFALFSLVASVGWGRAMNSLVRSDSDEPQRLLRGILSVDVPTLDGFLHEMKLLALVLLAVNIVSAIASPIIAGQYGKEKWIWSMKGFFGGAPTILSAVSLRDNEKSLDSDELDGSTSNQ